MNHFFLFIALPVLSFYFSSDYAAAASVAKPSNYVVFNIKGDCHQEDCIAALKDSLAAQQPAIISIEALSLAERQIVDYKTVTITFKDLSNAPYAEVMQKIAGLGYNVVSYAIHDLHTGHDVIIPH